MKITLLFLLMLFLCACGTDSLKDPKLILKKANEKCRSIQSGYYEMTQYLKLMMEKDTVKTLFKCYFKKMNTDTLFAKAFHYQTFLANTIKDDELYTGNELVSLYSTDSTADIMSCDKRASEISEYSHNYEFFTPITNKNGLKLSHDTDFKKSSNSYKLIGEEKIDNASVYHIMMSEVPMNDKDAEMRTISCEYHYWIKKSDFMPLQYSATYKVLMKNDTLCEYERMVLNNFEINKLKDESPLHLSSIPSYYTKKDFVPEEPLLLPRDTIAPDWELISLKNEKMNSKNLRGGLVLIEFFYKSCYACNLAMPMLESLNEKYKSKGLKVIGIDPIDKKEDIADLLSKGRVTYPVLLDGKGVSQKYRAFGFPTIYLIGRSGKVLFAAYGYDEKLKFDLEEVIKKNLGNKETSSRTFHQKM